MILKKEIDKVAQQKGVARTTVDKDWVLGHFIDAIFTIPECREKLIFKGGTCLRKCYFEDYRFSEDLDFTAVKPTAASSDFELSKRLLNEIMNLVQQRTEIPLHLQELKTLQHQDQLTGYSAMIKFWGADHPRNQMPPAPQRWTTSIKIEIILYEQVIFPIETKSVHHPYADHLSENAQQIPCYSLQEVLAEKLRALIQRSYTAPRDFYDIWYLSSHITDLNWPDIVQAFHAKMKFKGLVFTSVDQMINEENDNRLASAWNNSLAHQIPGTALPEYEQVKADLLTLFKELFKS